MDLGSLFAVHLDPLEIVVRGTAIYWFLFVLFRFVLRRDVGSIGIADVLLLVLIADAAQNAMSGGYKTVTEGFILVATIASWNYALDWGAFHCAALRRLVEPPPLALVRDGRVLRHNLRKELVSVSELKAKLREQGVQDFGEIAVAYMEADGEISLVRRDGGASQGGSRSSAAKPG